MTKKNSQFIHRRIIWERDPSNNNELSHLKKMNLVPLVEAQDRKKFAYYLLCKSLFNELDHT